MVMVMLAGGFLVYAYNPRQSNLVIDFFLVRSLSCPQGGMLQKFLLIHHNHSGITIYLDVCAGLLTLTYTK